MDLSKFLSKHLGACEGYDRGEVYIVWKEKDELEYPHSQKTFETGIYERIAEDILKFLKSKKLIR